MASHKIRKHLSYIEYLAGTSPAEREEQINGMKSGTLKFLINLILNVVFKKVEISDKCKTELREHRPIIEKLIGKNKSLKTRRGILKSDDTFKTLFDLLLPDLRKIVLQK